MKKLLAIAALALASFGVSHARAPKPPDVSGMTEASMNFDQAGVQPFLTNLARTFSAGFDARQARQLSAAIKSLPVESKAGWEFSVTFKGKHERLIVVAFKDDVEAPDLYFYTSAPLAAEIDRKLGAFAAAQGW